MCCSASTPVSVMGVADPEIGDPPHACRSPDGGWPAHVPTPHPLRPHSLTRLSRRGQAGSLLSDQVVSPRKRGGNVGRGRLRDGFPRTGRAARGSPWRHPAFVRVLGGEGPRPTTGPWRLILSSSSAGPRRPSRCRLGPHHHQQPCQRDSAPVALYSDCSPLSLRASPVSPGFASLPSWWYRSLR